MLSKTATKVAVLAGTVAAVLVAGVAVAAEPDPAPHVCPVGAVMVAWADGTWTDCDAPAPDPTGTPTATPTATPDPTGTPTLTPTATQTPSSTTTTSPGPVLHGRDITATNTGVQPGACPNGLQVFTTRQRASVLGSRTCVDLRAGITADTPITLEQSLIRVGENSEVGSGGSARLTLRWVTIDGNNTGTFAVVGHVDCYRCNITGASDGVRFDGTNIVESWIRVRQTSSGDHNDGIQAYGADAGGSILRSNIDGRPVNATSKCGNAAVFIADDSHGEVVIRDNWLGGGGYTLRLHESATYRVTGNVLTGWCFDPVTTTNAIAGAFVEWASNQTAAGTPVSR